MFDNTQKLDNLDGIYLLDSGYVLRLQNYEEADEEEYEPDTEAGWGSSVYWLHAPDGKLEEDLEALYRPNDTLQHIEDDFLGMKIVREVNREDPQYDKLTDILYGIEYGDRPESDFKEVKTYFGLANIKPVGRQKPGFLKWLFTKRGI